MSDLLSELLRVEQGKRETRKMVDEWLYGPDLPPLESITCRICGNFLQSDSDDLNYCPSCDQRRVASFEQVLRELDALSQPVPVPCATCGQRPVADGCGDDCFPCDLWKQRVAGFDAEFWIVANGRVYDIYPTTRLGGLWWRIAFSDGRILETNDVLPREVVPLRWRPQLPDTATLTPLMMEVPDANLR